MAAHARLTNELTEDEKDHNLMRWLNYKEETDKDENYFDTPSKTKQDIVLL